MTDRSIIANTPSRRAACRISSGTAEVEGARLISYHRSYHRLLTCAAQQIWYDRYKAAFTTLSSASAGVSPSKRCSVFPWRSKTTAVGKRPTWNRSVVFSDPSATRYFIGCFLRNDLTNGAPPSTSMETPSTTTPRSAYCSCNRLKVGIYFRHGTQ